MSTFPFCGVGIPCAYTMRFRNDGESPIVTSAIAPAFMTLIHDKGHVGVSVICRIVFEIRVRRARGPDVCVVPPF